MRKNQHKSVMFDILKILYNSKYAKILGFKWWTALYFFYWLPRFSVDLDFDLLQVYDKDETQKIKEWILNLLQTALVDKWIQIKYDWTLDYSFRYIVQYGWEKKLKLEFNTKTYDNVYDIKQLLWISVQIMDINYMFAHKLCAFISRYQQKQSIANRDLFDIQYLLNKNIDANDAIIQIRTKNMLWKQMTTQQYIWYLLDFIQKNKNLIQKNILFWLGELIDNSQKSYMKNKFLDDLIQSLGLRLLWS